MNADSIFIAAIMATMLALAYLAGRIHQESVSARLAGVPVEVDPFAAVPVEHAPHVPIIEATYLDPVTGPISTIVDAEIVVPLDDVKLLAMTEDRDRWKRTAQAKDRLRGRYLKLLRVERARLAYMLGDVMDAPRRPRKLALVEVQLPLPHGRHLSLVPPVKAREWREAS